MTVQNRDWDTAPGLSTFLVEPGPTGILRYLQKELANWDPSPPKR